MKKYFYLIVFVLALTACGKDGLDLKFRTVYKNASSNNSQNLKNAPFIKSSGAAIRQFGNFVGTLTPTNVTAKFTTIRYSNGDDSWPTVVDVVNGNWTQDDPRRFADFTNGNSVEVTPDIFGNVGKDGWFAEGNVVLKYLGIFQEYMLFEFNLPEQYNSVQLQMNHFPDQGIGLPEGFTDLAERNGNKMKCLSYYFLQHEYSGAANSPGNYIFGGTDSCYLVSANNIPSWEKCDLINMAGGGYVARSNIYVTPVLTPPDGSTKIVTTTISFDSQNLIQIYSGHDNIPYTSDDIFTFPPKFWERFSITLEQN